MAPPRLIRDFMDWSRGRLARPAALSILGAAVEGVGLVMLLPVVALILGSAGAPDSGPLGALLSWLPTDQGQALGLVTALFAAVLILRFAIVLAREAALSRLEQDFVADMRLKLFAAIADAPWAAGRRLGHGQVGHALSRDIDRAAMAIRSLLAGCSALAMLVVQLALAFWLAPFVAALVLALGLLVFAVMGPLRARAGRIGRDITVEDYQLFTSVSGFLRGLKSAKAHALTPTYVASFARASRGFADRLIALQRNTTLGTTAMQTAAGILAVLAVYIGYAWLAAPPETLIVVLVLMMRIGPLLQGVQGAIQGLRAGNSAYDSACAAILTDLPDAPVPPAGVPPWPRAPALSLDGVGRTGDGGVPLLQDITADIPAGKTTYIAGPSGAGKSTLIDVIAGLDRPDAGQVLIDGQVLDAAAQAGLAAALAYVGQDDLLLEETLRANLTRGLGDVSDDTIWQALATVGADGIVRASATGLDGRLRLDAQRFSGGERQRLRLARALLRQPQFLILDEATSALDPDAERAVLDAVRAALPRATIVAVSHRADTSARADHVIRLEAGRLA